MRQYPIVSTKNPLSFLQQRLHFIDHSPSTEWINLIDNVPTWEAGFPDVHLAANDLSFCRSTYEDCRGNAELRSLLATVQNGITYSQEISDGHIQVSAGALHAISLTLQCLRPQCRTFISLTPVFSGITRCAKALGYRVAFAAELSEHTEVAPDLSDIIDEHCVLYINCPNNPTGETFDNTVLEAIHQQARESGAIILFDAVYASYLFEGQSPIEIELENTYVFGSMSKQFGAPGLRIGWCTTTPDRALELSSLLEKQCVAVNSEAQRVALQLLQHGNEDLVLQCKATRDWLYHRLRRISGLRFQNPDAGLQVLVEVDVPDIELLVDTLMLQEQTAFTTSENYEGLNGQYLRIPIGARPSLLERGLSALERQLQTLSEPRTSVGEQHAQF